MPRKPPFSEAALRAAIETSDCWSDAARALGYEAKGNNLKTVQRWAALLELDVSHFDGNNGRRRAIQQRAMPLSECLVENSSYDRGGLKRRLLRAGLLKPACDMCGQGEIWRGRRLSLILDHINGVSNDNRIENLRLVCPNCNATLATHCGRNLPTERACVTCGEAFMPRTIHHRYCSMKCWGQVAGRIRAGSKEPQTRKVPRPSYPLLKREVRQTSWSAVGRKYGVSDNAVRKWVKNYVHRTTEDRDQLAAMIQATLDVPAPMTLKVAETAVLVGLDTWPRDPVYDHRRG